MISTAAADPWGPAARVHAIDEAGSLSRLCTAAHYYLQPSLYCASNSHTSDSDNDSDSGPASGILAVLSRRSEVIPGLIRSGLISTSGLPIDKLGLCPPSWDELATGIAILSPSSRAVEKRSIARSAMMRTRCAEPPFSR